jgi:hypothetical protein
MRVTDLLESSPATPEGSITDDLLYSKIWVVQTLKKLNKTNFSTVYILGSWYSNMSIVLDRLGISADKIINVDKNKKRVEIGKKMVNNANVEANIEHMVKDVNLLDYRQIDQNSIIINTSVLDIDGTGWWDNIPKGTVVVLQSRNETNNTPHEKLSDLENDFPMSKILFKDTVQLEDPETKYHRFMIVGIK